MTFSLFMNADIFLGTNMVYTLVHCALTQFNTHAFFIIHAYTLTCADYLGQWLTCSLNM